MKWLFGYTLCLSIGIAYVAAQEQPIATSVSSLTDGHVKISVTNHSKQPLTGLIIVADCLPLVTTVRRSTTVRYFDSVFNVFDRPIMPEDAQSFMFGGPDPGPQNVRCDVALKASVFADGSAFGDAEWAARIIRGRRYLYQHIGAALNLLHSALDNGTSREELIPQMQQTKKAKLSLALDFEEQRAIEIVFGEIGANLERSTRTDGSIIPVDQRIKQIMGQLLGRRQGLVFSKPSVTSNGSPAQP